MYCYRITKYNPKFRDHTGAYKKDDWISFSDIGKSFENKILSAEDYYNVEEAYIEAISFFMNFLGIDYLRISALEKKHMVPKQRDRFYFSDLLNAYQEIHINQKINTALVLDVARLALRE